MFLAVLASWTVTDGLKQERSAAKEKWQTAFHAMASIVYHVSTSDRDGIRHYPSLETGVTKGNSRDKMDKIGTT
jgi:hypothetical protein